MPKKKKYKVTYHGRQRIIERIGAYKRKDVYKVFDTAMKKGYSPGDLDKPLSTYLLSKCKRGTQVKLYNDMIFIYKYKNLITTYRLPTKYKRLMWYKEKMDEYCKEFVHVKIPKLLEDLLKSSSMFISMVEIGVSINILGDTETFGTLVEKYVRISSLIKVLKDKLQYDADDLSEYINGYNDVEDTLRESKLALERIEELSKLISDDRGSRKQMVNDITILDIMLRKIRKNSFYLEKDNKTSED